MKKIAAAATVAWFGMLATVYVTGFVPGTDRWAIRLAQSRVAQNLVDPSSAQFRNMVISKDRRTHITDRWVCGEVNGKNRMGAYAGFVPFYISEGGDGLWMLDSERPDDTEIAEVTAECSSDAYSYNRYACERQRKLVDERNVFDGQIAVYREACGAALGL